MNNLAPSQISAISRLFSSAVFKELVREGRSPMFARLATEVLGDTRVEDKQLVSGFFDSAFDILKNKEYRHEYIYKAALTKRVLLGKHSLNTASMLSEFRVGSSKADLVILNGTASVYEIKSERDSLSRLKQQIEDYRKVFAVVNVISGENHIESVKNLVDEDVGILSLSERYEIRTVREAAVVPEKVSPTMIFESIRRDEAVMILRLLGRRIPDVTNIEMHSALAAEFEGLAPQETHKMMVEVLKATRNLSPLSALLSELPESLYSAALTYPLRRSNPTNLINAINTPLPAALEWG